MLFRGVKGFIELGACVLGLEVWLRTIYPLPIPSTDHSYTLTNLQPRNLLSLSRHSQSCSLQPDQMLHLLD